MTLREYRLRLGLRLEDVGKKLNVDKTAVYNWEYGRNGICKKYHKKLAKLYGCTVEELLASETEKKE